MGLTNSQKIKLALLAITALMMLNAAIMPIAEVSSDSAEAVTTRHGFNPNLILFARGALDTQARRDLDISAADLDSNNQLSTASATNQKRTRIIQFAGPIKRAWIEALRKTGAEIIAYIPNNAYIIRGAPTSLAEVALMHAGAHSDDTRPIRWMGRFEPLQKIAPSFTDDLLASRATVDVEIELAESSEPFDAIELITSRAATVNQESRKFLNYVVVRASVPAQSLMEIAALDEVLFIGPAPSFELHDERSAQITAGNLSEDGSQPSGPDYKTWLESKGLHTPPDFVIDFTDSGLDRGSTLSPFIHPDLRDRQDQSRVAYILDYTKDGGGDDGSGHGSLVASVAAGLGSTTRSDAAGYMYGLGVDPAARIGASRIFDNRGKLPFQLSFTDVVSTAYEAGARLSNNSWGTSGNTYDATAQEYDALARDAQPEVAGNQEITFIFSAGNGGAGGRISSPGIAKNVISVAASENFRPEGIDSCNPDGQGAVGPDGADNAMDILRYSSGGPTGDGRAKPDLAAPGTHIYGIVSKSSSFNASGLCPGIPVYQPPGQDFYTWSSGTSLAAPHVAGAASLIRKYFKLANLLGNNRAPSPAMTKAFLINSAFYLTGENAGGNLPSERQGWGRVNLAGALDDTKRVLIDQTRLFTESGQTFEIEGSIADRSRGLRMTLAWTDAPGALAGAAIVNDLDLEIIVGGATLYRGNNFNGASSIEEGEADRLNNVESIYLPAEAIPQGAQGNFRIIVRAANIAGDGVPGNDNELDQDFALVIYNAANPVIDPPPPPVVEIPVIAQVTYEGKRLTITGQFFGATSQVEINGRVIEREFQFDGATNSLKIKLKYKKLNLKREADNLIVIIYKNLRSAAFTLRL